MLETSTENLTKTQQNVSLISNMWSSPISLPQQSYIELAVPQKRSAQTLTKLTAHPTAAVLHKKVQCTITPIHMNLPHSPACKACIGCRGCDVMR